MVKQMDAGTIKKLQDKWTQIAQSEIPQFSESRRNIENILDDLEAMGLDLEVNETYELLAPDLTKKEFQQRHAYIELIFMLDKYHQAQQTRHDYADSYVHVHYNALCGLVEYDLPEFEKLHKKSGLPADTSPLFLRELDFIRQANTDGTLEDEIKQAGYAAAIQSFRSAYLFLKSVESDNPADSDRVWDVLANCKKGQHYADYALELIDRLGDTHCPPKEVYLKRDTRGWGWKDEKGTFNRQKCEEYRDFLLITKMSIRFEMAREFQTQGQFVVSDYDGGFLSNKEYGNAVLPMQNILSELQENGYYTDVPETFERIGTDIDTFWACYHKERQAVANDNDHKQMLKAEMKR